MPLSWLIAESFHLSLYNKEINMYLSVGLGTKDDLMRSKGEVAEVKPPGRHLIIASTSSALCSVHPSPGHWAAARQQLQQQDANEEQDT